MGQFANRLRQMNSQWSVANEQGGQDEVPPAQYQVQVATAEIKVTKKGNLRATFRYLILDGDHAGKSVWDGAMLDGENAVQSMGFLKRTIRIMGYEPPEDPVEVENVLEQINSEQPVLLIEVFKSKDGRYTNCRVLERMGDAPAPTEEEPAAEAEAETEADEEGLALGTAVSFDNDGELVTGTVGAVNEDGTYNIDTDAGTYENVSLEELTVVEEGAADEADADLVTLGEAHGIEATADAVKAHKWQTVDSYTDEEVEVIQRYGGKFAAAKKAPATAKAPTKAPAKAPAKKSPAKAKGKR